jgi:lipopolysaccharide export LptBFGC system permease protein LptF
MRRFSTYLLKEIIPWLLLALVGTVLAFLTTQMLRVAPVFAGADVGLPQALVAIGLLLIPVVGWALTPAFVVAVFAAAGRLAQDGEMVALDAAGLGRFRMMGGPVVLAVAVFFLNTWLWIDVGPRSQAQLRTLAVELVGRALSNKVEAGVFVQPLEGITVFADSRLEDGTYKGIMIEDERKLGSRVRFVARHGTFRVNVQRKVFAVVLEQGTAFHTEQKRDAISTAVSFDKFEFSIALDGAVERHLDFLPASLSVPTSRLFGPPPAGVSAAQWSYGLWRRIAHPVGFLIVALLSIGLAFGLTWRRRSTAVALAAMLFLTYHLIGRAGESLLFSGKIAAPFAAFLPALVTILVLVIGLVFSCVWVVGRRMRAMSLR